MPGPSFLGAGPLQIDSASVSYFLNGNVGIGATSMAMGANLQLQRDDSGAVMLVVSFAGGADAVYALATATAGQDAAMFLDESDGRKLKFALGNVDDQTSRRNSAKLTIDQAGRVGVGATSPNELLEVRGPTEPKIRVTNTGMAGSPSLAVGMNQGNNAALFEAPADKDFKFRAGAGENLIITAGGKVGVGTFNPDGLQVNATLAEATQGVKNVRIGVAGGDSPRVILDDGANLWQIDNFNNKLRIFQPGVERLAITSAGDVYVGGRLAIDSQGRSTYAP